VQGQYPQPYQKPNPNHETAVSEAVATWYRRVRRDIQPKHVNAIHAVWKTKNITFSAWSIFQS
jgi:hypothetical protein